MIQEVDVLHAIQKWDGKDTGFQDGRWQSRFWKANDKEFYEGLSQCQIDETLLGRFAASNNNENPSRRTGGYSIVRGFCGGIPSWTPRINDFLQHRVNPARMKYQNTKDKSIIWALISELGGMKGCSKNGCVRPLNIVAASKLMFFACPEMPVFIYDSVVGDALSMPKLPLSRYDEWWSKCNELRNANADVTNMIPAERQKEFDDKREWFKRRCLDLMLYRLGGSNAHNRDKEC